MTTPGVNDSASTPRWSGLWVPQASRCLSRPFPRGALDFNQEPCQSEYGLFTGPPNNTMLTRGPRYVYNNMFKRCGKISGPWLHTIVVYIHVCLKHHTRVLDATNFYSVVVDFGRRLIAPFILLRLWL